MNACPNCVVGRLAATFSPYLADIEGYQVMIPYVPAQVCDVCGRIEYDADYVHLLDNLTSQPALAANKPSPFFRPYARRPAANPRP